MVQLFSNSTGICTPPTPLDQYSAPRQATQVVLAVLIIILSTAPLPLMHYHHRRFKMSSQAHSSAVPTMAATDARVTGSITPRSVTIPRISRAGVTSKAGL